MDEGLGAQARPSPKRRRNFKIACSRREKEKEALNFRASFLMIKKNNTTS